MKIRSILMAFLVVGLISAWATAEPNVPQEKRVRNHEAKANKEQAGKRQAGREMRRQQEKERMVKELNLTEEQQAQIKSIREKYASQISAIQDSNIPQEQKREQMQPIRRQMDDELDKVLTPEQKTKKEQLKKERHEKRMKARGEKDKVEKKQP